MEFTLLASLYNLSDFLESFYLSDFLDILIVTLFVYLGIILFKRTRSSAILAGVAVLIAVYILARVFNFYLTGLALQSFFSVFLFIIVILFQEELRRFFELLGLWGSRRPRRLMALSGTEILVEEVLQAVLHLANNKKGALIVFTGKEDISRFIEGEKVLDAVLSEELLESIFDPSSPGHDGVLVIEKGRAASFGGHLPLSSNFTEIGKHGTRHAAALGITERSDALAIVVSEERGTISIALSGKLFTISTELLKENIQQFFKDRFPQESQSFVKNIITRNSFEKILSFGIAFSFWFVLAAGSETIQRDVVVPISYVNIPTNAIVTSSAPKEITITLQGRGQLPFEALNQSSLKIDISGDTLNFGWNTVRLTEDAISSKPRNLRTVGISPKEVQVKLEQFKEVTREIKVQTSGSPTRGYRVASISVSPKEISLLVPENFPDTGTLSTSVIDIRNQSTDMAYTTELQIPNEARLPSGQSRTVSVSVSIERTL
jgi:uncharacterized protein (TIGR00159 family)